MKKVLAFLLVALIIGVTPAFAAEVSAASPTVDYMNVKGKGIDTEAASEILEQSEGGQASGMDNRSLNTTTEATNPINTGTLTTTTDPSPTTTDASTTTTESSATTETGETIEGIDNQATVDSTVDITPEINTTGIVMQTTSYTCGPAALATALNNLGINATEQELMNLAGTDENGTTMYGLVQAVQSKGLNATGMKLSINDLKPNNIVFITIDGGPHYSVVREVTADKVLLADPSLGNIEMSKERFAEVYSGNALVITDPNNSTEVTEAAEQPNI